MIFAFYAYAWSNVQPPPVPEETVYSTYYDINQNTLFNTAGIPDEASWDAYLERNRQAARKTASVGRYSSAQRCSCVIYARAYSGIDVGSIGFARNHPVNASVPSEGTIVVFVGSYTGHVAVVTSFTETTITITESNYSRCQIGMRTVSRTLSTIKGYYVK